MEKKHKEQPVGKAIFSSLSICATPVLMSMRQITLVGHP